MGSPIESWEGAEAYFTFANSPGLTGLFLVAAVAVVIGVIAITMNHEKKSFAALRETKK